MITIADRIRVLERMRELLSDPSRVVLNPMHYFEIDQDGETVELDYSQAKRRREECRVCFCGAATMACWELVDGDEWERRDEDIRVMLSDKAVALGVATDAEVARKFGAWMADDPALIMTTALKQGRAVEIVDAVLADLRSKPCAT